jgi:thiol-disulfide isomerase/thioredoxin
MKIHLPGGIRLAIAVCAFAAATVAVSGAETKKAPAQPTTRKAPELSPEEKKFIDARNKAMKEASSGQIKTAAEYAVVLEKAARELLKEFPGKSAIYDMLVQAAGYAEDNAKARALAKEVIENATEEKTKTRAQTLVKKLDRVGKPLAIKFTAVDGREVDLAKMKGKVVLVDFWATWCGPCIAEIPNVVKAYDRLHPKGFEIVGISFDQENAKEKLTTFVADKKMPWVQYFDGKGWNNALGQEFGINSIPAMWLVDKKGNLVDLNARGKLEEKVEKLLAE